MPHSNGSTESQRPYPVNNR